MNEALFSIMCFACNALTAFHSTDCKRHSNSIHYLLSFNTKILLKQFNEKFNPINNNSIVSKNLSLFVFLEQNFE
jgi:hypothetical protein